MISFSRKELGRRMRLKIRSFTKKRPFGVELELLASGITQNQIRSVISKLDAKHSVEVTGWAASNGSQWHVKTDSTCGLEVASYKGKGARGIINIARIADAVRNAGAKVDEKCGLHIHVEARDFNVHQMSSLYAHWMKIENIICQSLPKHRVNNIYCKLCSAQKITALGLKSPSNFWGEVCPTKITHDARRKSLNICNYALNPNKRTVEFRMPEGTFEPESIKNWIRFLVNFVHSIKKKPFPSNVTAVGLRDSLSILGLAHNGEPFYVLSSGLLVTKEWFLHRILQHTTNKALCQESIEELNKMWHPLKKYEIDEKCEEYLEIV